MSGFPQADVSYTTSFWEKNRPKYADMQRRRREATQRGDDAMADWLSREIKSEVSADVRKWRQGLSKG